MRIALSICKRTIRHFLNLSIKNKSLVGNFLSALYGYYICNKLRNEYGKDTSIILMRGATGDIYLQEILLPQFLSEYKISSYVLAGDGRLDLNPIFGTARIRPLSLLKSESIERAYMFFGAKQLNLILSFPWTDVLTQVNRCRIRMSERFNFMESYSIFAYRLNSNPKFKLPEFKKKNYRFEYSCYKRNIDQGRTVIIAPYACSVTAIFPMFWNSIILELKKRGYTVFVNDNKENFLRAANLFFTYEESVPLLEYAGYFIGLRSGLCDIISSAKCKKIILYPQTPSPLNYSYHRSDIHFSSLKKMGLCNDVIEIETNFTWDIKNETPFFNNSKEFINEYLSVIKEILKEFPNLIQY